MSAKNLPDGVTNRIILIRHGEPEIFARGRCYGKLDVGLSDAGKQQIQTANLFLQQFEVNRIYTSPRIRATESAQIIAAKFDLSIEPRQAFAEIDFGDFEGLEYREVERRFPALYHQWMTNPTTVQFPNGESFAQMQTRVLSEINSLRQRHQNETVAVVSHGGVNRIVLAHNLQIENQHIFRLAQDFAGVNVIDFYDEFPIVKTLNRTI